MFVNLRLVERRQAACGLALFPLPRLALSRSGQRLPGAYTSLGEETQGEAPTRTFPKCGGGRWEMAVRPFFNGLNISPKKGELNSNVI